MKAVIYARYSCDNQREESIEGQLRECKAFAERNGYTVVKVYADRAVSAKTDNRPEFQNMIRDCTCTKNICDFVIVWKLDRFARNRFDSAKYKAILKKNNVRVLSATEAISKGAEGIILESVLEGMAEYYSADLAEKVVRGMTDNVLNGKYNGSRIITYGYKVDENGYFERDTATAPIVTDIFNRYAEGETIRSIVDELNNKGITNNGKKFTYHFVNWLLKNRRYIGEYRFRDVVNTEAIPPLTTPEIFEKCQRRLSANKHKSASFRDIEEKYLLTGKVFCGNCGDSMSGVSGRGRTNNTYRYYQCMTNKRKRCNKKPIAKDVLENAVLSLTMQMFNNKSLIKRICDTCYEMQNTESTQLPALKKQLRQNKKEIDNVMKAIKAGLVTKSTKAELERLEEEQERIEIEIAKEQIVRPIISREAIESYIMRFTKTDLKSDEQKQRLIDIFVNSVHVYDDKIVVLFNYKDGERCVRIDDVKLNTKKENTQKSECSTSFKFGDPYGNRNNPLAFFNIC